MSRQFASLGTDTQKPFTFKIDRGSTGAPVFPVFETLKKGTRPTTLSPFKERQELDADKRTNRYQSINAGSSLYKRLSFEVRGFVILENLANP